VIRHGIALSLFWLALVCLLALVGVSILGTIKGRFPVAATALVLALFCPISCVFSFLRNPAPWAIQREIQSPEQETYLFVESSFLQGQTLVLARLRVETFFTRTMDVLVETNGDSPRSFLRIVRPAGAEDNYGQLYVTPGRFLLGLRTENRCFMAYDLNARK